jgi:vitamin B12 transporter
VQEEEGELKMRIWRVFWGITIFFGLMAQGNIGAAETSPDAVELEPVVVTATGTEVPLKDSTQSVSIIPEKEIKQQQAIRVQEVLRDTPGVNISQTGARGGTTSLFLRGGESDQVQALFNGIRINDAGGDFDFSSLLTTDNLSRIEVVRGPMSALYGADAMVGVVNVFTRKGVGPPTLNLLAGAGVHAEKGAAIEEYRATLMGSYKKFGFSIGWSHIDDPGILSVNNQFRGNTLVGRLDLDLLENLSFTYHTLLINSRYGFPTENGGDIYDVKEKMGPGLDPDQNSSKIELLQGLEVDYWPFKWWQNHLTLALSSRDRHFDDPANPPVSALDLLVGPHNSDFDLLFGSYNSRDRERRYSLDYRSNLRFGSREKVETITTLGFYAREEQLKQWVWTGTVQSPLLFYTLPPTQEFLKTRRGATAFYAQEQLNLWNRVFLVGGFRVENSTVFEQTEFIPRGSAAVHFPETDTTIRAAGGRAIKEPTFLESYSRSQLSLPNPDLKPEQNVSWEVGVDQFFLENNVQFSVTYFENYFNDFITYVPRDYPEPSTFDNIGAVRVAGLETSLFIRPAKEFTLKLAYTNIFSRIADDGDIDNLFFQTGKPLLRRPRNTFSFVANYAWDRLNVNLNGYYTGWREDSKFTYEYPYTFISERVDNRDYFVLNLAASYDVVRNRGYINKVQVWAKLNNLLDERYQEVYGYTSPGFSMLAGLRVIFGLKSQPGEKSEVSQVRAPGNSGLPLGLAEHHRRGNRL